MQTFLPYANFVETARVLDRRRLGKQRVEVLQILKALNGESRGWANHPAVRMWAGFERELIKYGRVICGRWIECGYQDTCFDKISAYYEQFKSTAIPPWLGREEIHSSHRAALLTKDFEFYSQFGWTETPALEYVWPEGGGE